MISYATEDNEDTEPTIEKTYRNKKLITLLILYSRFPKILKQSYSL